jgi:hypothetical protein
LASKGYFRSWLTGESAVMGSRTFVVELNPNWRVVVDFDQWVMQQFDMWWRDRATVDSAKMLRDLAQAFCQPISPYAAAIFAELPESAAEAIERAEEVVARARRVASRDR